MKKNDLIRVGDTIYRVLAIEDGSILAIDCIKRFMPSWIETPQNYTPCSEAELLLETGVSIPTEAELSTANKGFAHQKYTLIAPIIAVIDDIRYRGEMLNLISKKHNITKVSLRKYLCSYLAFQNIWILATKPITRTHQLLSDEQRNFRYALNKYYYNSRRNTLKTAYTLLLKEKYCDVNGELIEGYPPFHRFKYFYRTHKNIRTELISRDGLSNYQRNHRPLLGNGVREFCPTIGYGMVDSTVCDIYLVNESGELVGRPILTLCLDAFSSMIMGCSVGWIGGISSVSAMFQNILANKVEHCKKFGIDIKQEDWDCTSLLPSVLLTDRGREYLSGALEHLTELGVTVINLDSYRPELKGSVEQCFNVLQNLYKPYLKGKGVIMENYLERGVHNYKMDACLTLSEFEKVILRCIIFYNTQRIIENFPYSDDEVKPYANAIWNYYKAEGNLIKVEPETLYKTLLPRTTGKFSRHGLKVGRLHYKALGFVEEYLRGDSATVAYNPKDVSSVYLFRDGEYFKFTLIETTFMGKSIDETEQMIQQHSKVIQEEKQNSIQAQITLADDILTIADGCTRTGAKVKNIRRTRKKERGKK